MAIAIPSEFALTDGGKLAHGSACGSVSFSMTVWRNARSPPDPSNDSSSELFNKQSDSDQVVPTVHLHRPHVIWKLVPLGDRTNR